MDALAACSESGGCEALLTAAVAAGSVALIACAALWCARAGRRDPTDGFRYEGLADDLEMWRSIPSAR